jgi:hypothetical protein
MDEKSQLIDNALIGFKRMKIFMLSQVQSSLGCSLSTVKRRLKQWNTYTSFNHNGRFYCLPEIPDFDCHGIWRYEDAAFSKHGNLKKTVRSLIDRASCGLSAPELTEILGIPAYGFLSHFKDDAGFRREKFKGLYIYFSEDEAVFEGQRRQRISRLEVKAAHNLPTDAQAVTILVTWIKHPGDDVETLRRRVRRSGLDVSVVQVRNLLDYHDLLKKR